MNIVNVDDVYASPAPTVPGIEAITGAAGQPANISKAAAKANSNAPSSTAKTEEGNVRRRPDRIVSAVNRSRPPAPTPSINEPATVVVRRPAPRFVGHPGPAVVGLKYPAAISVRCPVGATFGKPHAAVVRHIPPMSIIVKVVGAGVIRIGVAPTRRALDDVVAIVIPLVPIVFSVGSRYVVLRVVRVPLNRDS